MRVPSRFNWPVNTTPLPFPPPHPRQTQYPLCRKLGGPQGRSGRVHKISPPPRFQPRTVQPVASHYFDCAKLFCNYIYIYIYYKFDRGPHNTNWRAEGWTSLVQPFEVWISFWIIYKEALQIAQFKLAQFQARNFNRNFKKIRRENERVVRRKWRKNTVGR